MNKELSILATASLIVTLAFLYLSAQVADKAHGCEVRITRGNETHVYVGTTD